LRASSWLAPAPPTVAIEIAVGRVTVVGIAPAGGARRGRVTGQASEPLPDDAVRPGLAVPTLLQPTVVAGAIGRALERAGQGSARRAALVVPDSLARVSLLTFETLPARAAELDELVRWQLRKAAPFPLEEAQVTHFVASRQAGATVIAAVVARRDVIAEYEQAAAAAGIHAGLVDLASFNVMNAALGAGIAPAEDWLLVHRAAEATTLAVLRGANLLFYRHRTAIDEEPLGALVHQTAMYHEDRLGGGAFARVLLSGAGAQAAEARAEIGARLNVPVDVVNLGSVAALEGAPPEAADALAAPIGILLRHDAA
jgi:type IV pilus assembly protein PilM